MVHEPLSSDAALLRSTLGRCRAGVVRRQAARRCLITLAAAGAWLSLLALAFALLPWTLLPLAWDLSLALLSLALVLLCVDATLLRPYPLARAAAELEQQAGLPHQPLSIGLQLATATAAGSPQLAAEAVRRAALALAACPRAIRRAPLRRPLLAALAATGAVLTTHLLCSPSVASCWDLPLRRVGDAVVTPGSVSVPLHGGVVLRLAPCAGRYPSCRLVMRRGGERFAAGWTLRPDSVGAFSFAADSLAAGFSYEFSLGGRAFGPHTITVVAPPRLQRLRLTLTPPAYTGQPRRVLPEGQGGFSAFAGTTARLTVASGFPLRRAVCVLSGGDTLPLTVSGAQAEGSFTVRRTGSYTFALADTLGQASDSLPSFLVELLPDEPPLVQVLRPGANKALDPQLQESLLVEAVDDLGLRRLSLCWRTSTDTTLQQRDILPPGASRQAVRSQVAWDLTPLQLYPGDTVFYWALAQDGKPWPPPNLASSDTFWMRVPGFEEISRQLAQQTESAGQNLREVREQQEKLRDDLADMVRRSTGERQLSWERKQVLADVQQQIGAQRDSLASAVRDLQQAVESMRREGLADEPLLRKMDEVRKAIEELVRQYGDSLLFDRKDMDAQLSAREMTQAVERMRQMLPQLGERLEQALQYLAQLRRDQELAALASRLEKLSQRQQELSSLADAGLRERRQEELLRGTEQLSAELRERMQPGEEQLLTPQDAPSLGAVDSLGREMRRPASERQNAGQCRSGMSAALQSTADELRSLMGSSMVARMQQQRERMLDIVGDALTLSQWQQEQAAEAQRSGSDATALTAGEQVLGEALGKAAAKLDSLTLVPPRLLQAVVGEFDAAQLAMARAEKSPAGPAGQAAMAEAGAHLNGAAQALLAAADAMMQGQGGQGGAGSGLAGAMRKLSGRQAAINAATGELLRQMMQAGRQPGGSQPGGEGGQGSRVQAEAARAQQALADQLKQLADEYGNQPGGQGQGRLKDLEEEARRLARMLENPAQELRDRQDRFLARMLETSLSIHKEGEGKQERTSRSATIVFAPDSGAAPAAGLGDLDAFYRLRRKALDAAIPPEYRVAVKAYFDSLGAMYLNAGRER